MLIVFQAMNQINFGQLMDVYEETNHIRGEEEYPNLFPEERRVRIEQNLYAYIRENLYAQKNGFCCVWAPEGRYVAALRMEQYKDGWLLTALETDPAARNKGYGKALVNAVLTYMAEQGASAIYTHVNKQNKASLAVHYACGFQRLLEYAVFLDGSVSQKFYTLYTKLSK